MEELKTLELLKKNIAELVIEHYGSGLQCIIAIEEMAELQKAISKSIRVLTGGEFGVRELNSIAEEIADVEIVLEQLKQIFGCHEAVEEWTRAKLKRTLQRMSDDVGGVDGRARTAEARAK